MSQKLLKLHVEITMLKLHKQEHPPKKYIAITTNDVGYEKLYLEQYFLVVGTHDVCGLLMQWGEKWDRHFTSFQARE